MTKADVPMQSSTDTKATTPIGPAPSFRVSNSVIQNLTTSVPSDLNRLPALDMLVLLGLMQMVNQKAPEKEVRTTPSKLLEVLEVSRNVAHAVTRKWSLDDGTTQEKEYPESRYSPAKRERLDKALRGLFELHVEVTSYDRKAHTREKRLVHVLDSFGYSYFDRGRAVDLDDVAPPRRKVNVGSEDRPVYRLVRQEAGRERRERAAGVSFRLNAELAAEIRNEKNTIGFTLLAGRVFQLLRRFHRRPLAIRLFLLVERQTGEVTTRSLSQVLTDVGGDSHDRRVVLGELQRTLEEFRDLGVVKSYDVDPREDLLRFEKDDRWRREPT